MRTLYLRKEDGLHIRKVLIDMAYLVSHREIRLPKIYLEEGLYLPYYSSEENQKTGKYFLSKENIIKEDEFHYYFDFPFKAEQVEDAAD